MFFLLLLFKIITTYSYWCNEIANLTLYTHSNSQKKKKFQPLASGATKTLTMANLGFLVIVIFYCQNKCCHNRLRNYIHWNINHCPIPTDLPLLVKSGIQNVNTKSGLNMTLFPKLKFVFIKSINRMIDGKQRIFWTYDYRNGY